MLIFLSCIFCKVSSFTVSQIPSSGTPPPAFLLSRLAFADSQLFSFGGLLSSVYYNDLWSYSTIYSNWTRLQPGSQSVPSPRVYPVFIGAVDILVLFSGQISGGTNGDLWIYNITSHLWKEIAQQGDIPGPRMNSAFCTKGNTTLYIYGGDTVNGADSSLYM